jgi:glycosyltransferase involved in cell wall biosynthesis
LQERIGEFDVAHIFGLYDLLGPAAAKACVEMGVPYVVEPIGMFVPIVRNVRMKRIYHWFYGRKMLASAARVIATSEQEMEELSGGGIPRENIVLRRNGVMKPEQFPERGNFRRKSGISANDLVVLFLGRLSEKKSPDLLLRAFSRISGKVGERVVRLVFAGPDEQGMEARLRKLAKELKVEDRNFFCGAVFEEEKWAAYRDADVFVLPSQNENFGNTAAEAAAVGTPVIVTENCGVAPLLAEGGAVIPHDEGALVQALDELLQNETLRERLGRQAMAAARKIGWEGPVQETEALYRKLAEKQ